MHRVCGDGNGGPLVCPVILSQPLACRHCIGTTPCLSPPCTTPQLSHWMEPEALCTLRDSLGLVPLLVGWAAPCTLPHPSKPDDGPPPLTWSVTPW